MSLPKAYRQHIYNSNPLERLNAESKRCSDMAAIFPDDADIVRPVGAMLPEWNDEGRLQRRYMPLEGLQSLK
ncbi:transposase [Zestomonas thermotolerans]|jgi:putative transposase|uniref:transposase n=1 Tax=Zestomonas thermotolerans TaxID=157784 RepID=UPI00048A29D0|nr:transposase [Pseudomonas thermotolerans]